MPPVATRSICGIALAIMATVVLGISAHVENSSRMFGIKTSTFTYDAFLGAFTIVAELVSAVVRLRFPTTRLASFLMEVSLATVYVILWIAGGISTTKFTEEGLSVCKHLDDLFDLPDFENDDAETLAAAKKALKSACSELHAELVFIWLAFALSLFVMVYLVYLGMKHHVKGNKAIWYTSLASYKSPSADPFADPEGNHQGRSAGVVDPNEEIVYNH